MNAVRVSEVAEDEVTLMLAPLLEAGALVWDHCREGVFHCETTINRQQFVGRGSNEIEAAAALMRACGYPITAHVAEHALPPMLASTH